METISQEELVNYLLNVPKRASFISFVARTTPRMRKTGNPFYNSDTKEWFIRKVSNVRSGIINFRYKNVVENQREREQGEDFEPFEPQPRPWGSRIEGTPLVEHKGKYYLEVKVEKRENVYVDLEGNKIDYGKIDEFLYSSSQPSTQKTEKDVSPRDFSIGSIEEISMYNEQFEVE